MRVIRIPTAVAGLMAGVWALCGQQPTQEASAKPSQTGARILFVGNSYTYYNNLPEMVAALAKAGGQGEVVVKMVAPGGWRLKDHWEKGEARSLLSQDHWDYVVLQDQSELGVNYYVDGRTRIAGDEFFRPYANRWSGEIRKTGAVPVFYLTWAPRDAPEDQVRLNFAYIRAAREGHAVVGPAGMAWSQVRREHPAIELFYKAGSHPSSAGTYLVACSIYSAIFNRTPVGLPSKIVGHPVNLETEKVEVNKTVSLAELTDDEAAILQSAAWAAQQDMHRQSSSYEPREPALPSVPPLPKGLSLGAIAGEWTGTISFYPVGPVDMVLRLSGDPVRSARLDLRYPAERIPNESIDIGDLRIKDGMILFSDPKSDGVDGLAVQFRGVRVGKDELLGIAETSVERPDRPIRVIGTWHLRMQSR